LTNKIVVIAWGDPHIQTLDNLQYTFNGLGEYWMVKSSGFELQARTDRAWNSTKQPSATGTVFSAVAGRALYEESNMTVSTARVHVEMPADRTSGTLTDDSNTHRTHTHPLVQGGPKKRGHSTFCRISRKLLKISTRFFAHIRASVY